VFRLPNRYTQTTSLATHYFFKTNSALICDIFISTYLYIFQGLELLFWYFLHSFPLIYCFCLVGLVFCVFILFRVLFVFLCWLYNRCLCCYTCMLINTHWSEMNYCQHYHHHHHFTLSDGNSVDLKYFALTVCRDLFVDRFSHGKFYVVHPMHRLCSVYSFIWNNLCQILFIKHMASTSDYKY
jgi:hypothetical protein